MKSIVQFVKRERRQNGVIQYQANGTPVFNKVGVFFAYKDKESGKIALGVTKAHRHDAFSDKVGTLLAMGKAMNSVTHGVDVPYSFAADFLEFKERCTKYFQYELVDASGFPVMTTKVNRETGKVEDCRATRNAVDEDFVEIRVEPTPDQKRQAKVQNELHLTQND